MKRPVDLLVYYGYMNSFNSAAHAWDNEKVAQEMARYGMMVFGNGVAASSHGDYANAKIVIARIKELSPCSEMFGYVSVNQTMANFKTKVDEWAHADIDIHGIFLDEAGYDYGSASTNGRLAFNERVQYVHSKGMMCFVNAWKPEHVLSNDPADDDASYLNSTYNPDALDTLLEPDDVYLLESHAHGPYGAGSPPALQYESETQWKSRADKALEYEGMIRMAALSQVDDADSNGQDKFDFLYVSALMFRLDIMGSAHKGHGASDGKTKMWERSSVSELEEFELVVSKDGSKYLRYMEGGMLKIDYTNGSESSEIVNY